MTNEYRERTISKLQGPSDKGLIINLCKLAQESVEFRTIVQKTPHSEVVTMNVAPGKNIGREIHPKTDQYIMVLSGNGYAILSPPNKSEYIEYIEIDNTKFVTVPAGVAHDIYNYDMKTPLKLLIIYSNPLH